MEHPTQILTQSLPEFNLLETLLWRPESGYFLLDLHLQRLSKSAAFFDFLTVAACASLAKSVQHSLTQIASTFPPVPHKVRLQVTKQGEIQMAAEPFQTAPQTEPLRVAIAPLPIQSTNIFLHHKTTNRSVYEQARQSCPGCDDVLLWNERGEITESCIANLILEREGQWYTPPLHSGLLAGTLRQWLLQRGKVQERLINREELLPGDRILLINSVRHIQTAVIEA